MTPYAADSYHEQGMYFAAHGLPFVIVDVRGRGNSGGLFRPFIQEGKDGYDVTEWLARQAYCDGRVAMWGGSYLGSSQWASAKERPPHLTTIVPTASAHAAVDFPMRNNVFYPYIARWLLITSGHTYQRTICHDEKFWSVMNSRWHESGRPFRDFDTLLGTALPVFQEWLQHPEPDEYWDAYGLSADEYRALEIPILTITGVYDADQPGALEYYREHMRYASPEGRSRHYLIVGPWDHAGTVSPRRTFGGIQCADAGVLDLARLHLEWYAWVMGRAPRPEFLKDRVAYYVMGAERWRYVEKLEDVTSRCVPFFLDSLGDATDVFRSGAMSETPGKGPPDSFRYDPGDTSGPELAAEACADAASLVDQTQLYAMNGRQVIYQSSPFEEDTEISGFFSLSVWVAIDCPDTDLYASVHDVGLDGGSVQMSTDVMRARYREGLRTPKLITDPLPRRYDFNRFTFVSREVKRGHRLRLVICPVGRIGATTFTEKNYNAGGVVAQESVSDARAVTVTVFHDAERVSALYVPLGRPDPSPAEPDR
jgi:putative CocE/NonD family hydrolase